MPHHLAQIERAVDYLKLAFDLHCYLRTYEIVNEHLFHLLALIGSSVLHMQGKDVEQLRNEAYAVEELSWFV